MVYNLYFISTWTCIFIKLQVFLLFFFPFFQFYMLERSHFPHSPLKINTSGLNMTTHICIYVCKTKALSLNVLVFTVIIAAAGKILSIESVWGFLWNNTTKHKYHNNQWIAMNGPYILKHCQHTIPITTNYH